jgi:hypothetical protein
MGPLPHRGAGGVVVHHDRQAAQALRERARYVKAGFDRQVRGETKDPGVVHQPGDAHTHAKRRRPGGGTDTCHKLGGDRDHRLHQLLARSLGSLRSAGPRSGYARVGDHGAGDVDREPEDFGAADVDPERDWAL